jgi:pyrroloquinoline quinone (PQQ) biosynthesis protein C
MNTYFTKRISHFINHNDDWDTRECEDIVEANSIKEAQNILEKIYTSTHDEPPYIYKYLDASTNKIIHIDEGVSDDNTKGF